MIVCAEFPDDGLFYRARVVKIRSAGSVRVEYVDYGNEADVAWSQVLKLADQFLTLPALAAKHCSLKLGAAGDVIGAKELGILFRQLAVTSGCRLEMSLAKAASEDCRKLEVQLWDKDKEKSINGALMHLIDCNKNKGNNINYVNNNDCDRNTVKGEKMPDEVEQMRKFAVTHVVSPDEIWVRPEWLDRQWKEFQARIDFIHSQRGQQPLTKIKEGQGVVVLMDNMHYYRGKVLTLISDAVVVRLVDNGRSVEVSLDYVRPISEELRYRNAFCHRVRMAGLAPAGGGRKWTHSAAEAIGEILGCQRYVMLAIDGDMEKDTEDGEPTIPVEIYCEGVASDSPFTPGKKIFTDVAGQLVERGLALDDKGDRTSKDVNLRENPFLDCGLRQYRPAGEETFTSAKEINERAKVKRVDTFTPLLVEGSSLDDTSDDKETQLSNEDEECQREQKESSFAYHPEALSVFTPKRGACWAPPVLPTSNTFDGQIAYIDVEGQLYIQSRQHEHEILEMSRRMEALYAKRPFTLLDRVYKVGDLCMARYPGQRNLVLICLHD